ncbi:MAG: hypothetical protein AAGH38_04180 [Pseudomonadota bacterium]
MDKLLTLNEKLQDAAHLQKIEGNPLDADDIAMFEMFEREGWSPEQRRAYIIAQETDQAPAAE